MPDDANDGDVSAATEMLSAYVSVSPSTSVTVHVMLHEPDELGEPLTDDDVVVKPEQVPLTEYDNGELPPLAEGRVKLKY